MKKTIRRTIILVLILVPLLGISATITAASSALPEGEPDSQGAALAFSETGGGPTIVLTKTVSADAGVCGSADTLTVVPGTTVNYCFAVENTSLVTATLQTLVDDQLGTLLNSDTITITPGGTYVYSTTTQITDPVTNTATWTADDGLGNTGQAVDSATVTIYTPSIAMTKTVGTGGVCGTGSSITVVPGTVVTYCYQVTNTGLVTLTQQTLVDDKLGTLINNEGITIVPGASHAVSTTAQVINPVTNIATWTASDAFGHSVNVNDTATVSIFNPTILLSKTVNLTPGICQGTNNIQVVPGTLVNYCYKLTNTGQVTVTTHTLTDNKLGLLFLNKPITVGPAQTFTYSTTEVITQSVTNIGTWSAGDGFGHLAGDNDNASVTVLLPSILLTKTVSAVPGICAPTQVITVTAGSDVTYCYTIQNTSQVTVTSHTLVDSDLGPLFTDMPEVVAPGATYVFSTTIAINVTTTNIATWTAEEPFGHSAQGVDSATVNVTNPGMLLNKTVGTNLATCPATSAISVIPGTTVNYCFKLQNTGTTTFTSQTLIDDQLGILVDNEAILIPPGDTYVISQTALITQPVTNIATWIATDVFSNEVQTQDSATVNIIGVSLELTKTVSAVAGVCAATTNILVAPGSSVTYCYEIRNTGQVPLETHTLVDSALGLLLNGSSINVPPGSTYVYSTTVVINTSVTNFATWTANDPYENVAVDSDSATVTVIVPVISVTPLQLISSQAVSQVVTLTLDFDNLGGASLTWSLDENQVPGASQPTETPLALGDQIATLDFGAALGNDTLLGIEYANESFWVTAFGVTGSQTESNLLYQFDSAGTLMNVYTQTTAASGFGWRDLAFDGTFLYGSDTGVIEEIDPANGAPTGTIIPSPITPARALAYDPATDHFWLANFGSLIYEIDRAGNVINAFANNVGNIYGLAWDDFSPGGPFLWAWTSDSPPKAVQLNPLTGQPTGINFTGTASSAPNTGAGVTITADLYPNKLVLIGMHQAGNGADAAIIYDLGVATGLCAGNANPWVSVSSTGGTIFPLGSTQVSVTFDSTGLSPGTYTGHLCILSDDPQNPILVVSLKLIVAFANNIYLPVIHQDQ